MIETQRKGVRTVFTFRIVLMVSLLSFICFVMNGVALVLPFASEYEILGCR